MFIKRLWLGVILAVAASGQHSEHQKTNNDEQKSYYRNYPLRYVYHHGLNPVQFQGPYAYQGYPYQFVGQYPYQYQDQLPYQYQEQLPYQYQEQLPYQYQEQFPYQHQDQYPFQSYGQYPFQYVVQYPYHYPVQYRGQYPYQYQDPYVYQGQNYQNQFPFSGFPYNYYQVAAH